MKYNMRHLNKLISADHGLLQPELNEMTTITSDFYHSTGYYSPSDTSLKYCATGDIFPNRGEFKYLPACEKLNSSARTDLILIEQYTKRILNYFEKCVWRDNYDQPNLSTTNCFDYTWHGRPSPPSPSQRLREMIQARQAPIIVGTRMPVSMQIDEREQRARDTLRRLVGEPQYRRFLAHGFITARGKSGKVYQIRPGHGMTSVYSSSGERIEKLCVVLRGNFPPTDELITRFLMILNDEEHFRSLAHAASYSATKSMPKQPDSRQLPEIFEAFKRQAA